MRDCSLVRGFSPGCLGLVRWRPSRRTLVWAPLSLLGATFGLERLQACDLAGGRCVVHTGVQAVGMGGLARPGSRGVGLSQSERATGTSSTASACCYARFEPAAYARLRLQHRISATLSLCPASLFQRQPLKVGLFQNRSKHIMCAMQCMYIVNMSCSPNLACLAPNICAVK